MKTRSISRFTLFKLRVFFTIFCLAGVFLAAFATGSPQTLTPENSRHVDAWVRGPNEIALATSAGVQEAWVARYDGPGNDFDEAEAIAVDNSANVCVTGRSSDPDFSTHYATVKYNSAGQEQWVARYYGPRNYQDTPTAIAVDNSGNVYVTGYSFGSANNYDFATIKYSPVGQEQWVARYNGPNNGNDGTEGIAVDRAGNVYVTGVSRNADGFSDYATIRYNSAGQQEWVARYNGAGNRDDYAVAIAVDNSGNVYVTGSSWGSTTDYDYATSSTTQPDNNNGSPATTAHRTVLTTPQPSPLTSQAMST